MTNGNGWRAEPHGGHYLLSNGRRYLLAGHGNDYGTPYEFNPVTDTAMWQWALARLNGKPADVSSVDKDGYVWIIGDDLHAGESYAYPERLMLCVGRIDETEAGWEAFAPNGTLLRHWHGWNADGASSGYPDQADAVRAVVKFHDLTAQSRATALATGSPGFAITEEGPWSVKWSCTTGATYLVVAKEVKR